MRIAPPYPEERKVEAGKSSHGVALLSSQQSAVAQVPDMHVSANSLAPQLDALFKTEYSKSGLFGVTL